MRDFIFSICAVLKKEALRFHAVDRVSARLKDVAVAGIIMPRAMPVAVLWLRLLSSKVMGGRRAKYATEHLAVLRQRSKSVANPP